MKKRPHLVLPIRSIWANAISHLITPRMIAVLGVVLGIMTIGSISMLQEVSDRANLTEISLRHLQSLSHELNAIEETATAEHLVTPRAQHHLKLVNQEIKVELGNLRSLTPNSPTCIRITNAYMRYSDAETEQLQIIADGKINQSEAYASLHTDPAFDELSKATKEALLVNAGVSLRAHRIAEFGTGAILLIAALAVALLFRQTARTQRTGVELQILRQSEERFRALVANSSDVIIVVAPDRTMRYMSPTSERLWGCQPTEWVGRPVTDLLNADESKLDNKLNEAAVGKPGEVMMVELNVCHADGTEHVYEILIANLISEPSVEGFVLTCRDINDRKLFAQQMQHHAFHDVLTGLPNRALFMERLNRALNRAQRQQTPIGVIFLDLDNFKLVNDSLGHEAGDRLLIAIAERLNLCVRPGDTVARLGGDEFTVLIEEVEDETQIVGIAERISEVLKSPVMIGTREVFTSGSLGIVVNQGEERTADEIVRDADMAMYQAKTSGKALSVVFDRSMNGHAVERMEMETALRHALEHGEFRVHYQPILILESGAVAEVEALVRWEHPTEGLLPPARFVSLAEETALIVPLGLWVLREACRQTREWHNQYPLAPPLMVSVNLSCRQLLQSDLVQQVADVLSETRLPASSLKLEITESVMMQDTDTTILKLHALKALGVHLAVDDFGTGYSSMAYLSTLPVDTLKIDRSFIGKLGGQSADSEIVRAIVSLAKTLNLSITSEGIETSEQSAQLLEMGCDQGQGYYFARPQTAEAIDILLCKAHTQFTTETDSALLAA